MQCCSWTSLLYEEFLNSVWKILIHPVYLEAPGVVVELSMVMPLLSPQSPSLQARIFLSVLFGFWFAFFNILDVRSQTDRLVNRLNSIWAEPETRGANGENLLCASTEDVQKNIYHFNQW